MGPEYGMALIESLSDRHCRSTWISTGLQSRLKVVPKISMEQNTENGK